MDDLERLAAFFDAENRRDWEAYRAFLHPEVEWELRQPDGRVEFIRGPEEYMARIQAAYAGWNGRFRCEAAQVERDSQVVVRLVNDRGEVSRERFRLRDGLVWRETEYLEG